MLVLTADKKNFDFVETKATVFKLNIQNHENT
jgi:hypothetical protein